MNLHQSKAKIAFSVLLFSSIAACSAMDSFAPSLDPGESIRIDSNPSGAELFIMGKRVGTTPVIISDRDIYPVTYNGDTEKYYGKVILRKDQCEEYSKRLSRADISNGLTAFLDCSAREPVALSSPEPAQKIEVASNQDSFDTLAAASESSLSDKPQPQSAPLSVAKPTPEKQKISSERRLQQLRLLQELLEEGLLSHDEEEALRKRILNAQ